MAFNLETDGAETTVLLHALSRQAEYLREVAAEVDYLAVNAALTRGMESAIPLRAARDSFLADADRADAMYKRLLEPEEEVWTDPGYHICGGPSH